MDITRIANDAARICRDGKAAGKSDSQIIVEVAASPSILPIIVAVLPAVLAIMKDMRNGKSFFEALLDNIDVILEAILPLFEGQPSPYIDPQ